MNTNAVNQVAENVSGYTESEKSSKVSGKTIGEPKLSDKAKEYYEKLKKKFSTMDFILVSKDCLLYTSLPEMWKKGTDAVL